MYPYFDPRQYPQNFNQYFPQSGSFPLGGNIMPGMGNMNGYPALQPLAPYFNVPLQTLEELNEDTDIFIEQERQPQQPVVTNPTPTISIVLRKELTGYPNYGNPSRNADILYTGNQATYTFNLPFYIAAVGTLSAAVIFRGILDDHYAVNQNLYTANIEINGRQLFSGNVPFVHGRPAGGIFDNWRNLRVNVPDLRRNNVIRIRNTSRTGPSDWIGLDWIEMRLIPR